MSIGKSGLAVYESAMKVADAFKSGTDIGIQRAERKAAFDQQYKFNQLRLSELKRQDDRAETATYMGVMIDQGLVSGDLGELDRAGFDNQMFNQPDLFEQTALNAVNNSFDIQNSPTGAQFDSMRMSLTVTDPSSGAVVETIDMFSQGARQKADQARQNGFAINTSFSFSGANVDGSPAVLTDQVSSDANATVVQMSGDELYKMANLTHKERYYKGGPVMAKYEELMRSAGLGGPKAEIAKQQLAQMDYQAAKQDRIQRIKNHFADKGQHDAVRAITQAAITYGEDSPEFNNTLSQLAEDIKIDEQVKNSIVIDATSNAAKELKIYRDNKDKFVVPPNAMSVAESIATSAPDDELSIAFTERLKELNNASADFLTPALADSMDKRAVRVYGTKMATLANIEKELEDIRAGKDKIIGSGRSKRSRAATKADVEKLEKKRIKLTKDLESQKIKFVDEYIEKNPDAPGVSAYLQKKADADVAATHIASSAEIANYQNPTSLLEAINDGSLKISPSEISAHQEYLKSRNVSSLTDASQLPFRSKFVTLANLMFLEQNEQSRVALMNSAVTELFPANTFNIYSPRTDAVAKAKTPYDGFGSLMNEIEKTSLTAFDYSYRDLDSLSKEEKNAMKTAQNTSIQKLLGTGSGDGLLDQLNEVIQSVGKSGITYDPQAFDDAAIKEREIVSQLYRLHATNELGAITAFFTGRGRDQLGRTSSDSLVYVGGKLNYIDTATGKLIGDTIEEDDFANKMRIPKGTLKRIIAFAKENTAAKFPELQAQ